MRISRCVIGLPLLLFLGAWGVPRINPSTTMPRTVCLAASSDSLNRKGSLVLMMTRPDSIFAAMRTGMGVQVTTPENVEIITTESNCIRAAFVIDSLLATPNSGRKILMFRLGTSFGAESPAHSTAKGVGIIYLFNGQMDFLHAMSLGG